MEDVGPSSASPFNNIVTYLAENMRSKLTEGDLARLHDKYGIPRGLWHVYPAEQRDRIYHNPPIPEGFGDVTTGISEAAFKCGFRVPLLPLLKSLLKNMGLALGQLDPNSFIHVNCFQARCLAAKIYPRAALF